MVIGLLCSLESRDEGKWFISSQFYCIHNRLENRSIATQIKGIETNLIIWSDEIFKPRDCVMLMSRHLASTSGLLNFNEEL